MEKDRGTRALAVVALLVAVVGMTIGFAAFSTTLTIQGTGQVKGSTFSVIFENLGAAVPTGTAQEATGGTPTIKTGSTTISNYQVELMTPGDSISYTFDITNNGTYDAEISAITMAGRDSVPFAVSGGDTTDQENVKGKLEYTLKYVGGTKDGQNVDVGNELAAGETETVKLTLTYTDFEDESLLPKATVTITNLEINIDYTQA